MLHHIGDSLCTPRLVNSVWHTVGTQKIFVLAPILLQKKMDDQLEYKLYRFISSNTNPK